MSEENEWVWEYFEFDEIRKYIKCNKCDFTYSLSSNYYVRLKYHLYHKHNIIDVEDNLRWKNDNKDEIWKYYSKRDGYKAQCNAEGCISLAGYSKSNLMEHLSRHLEIVDTIQKERVTNTWLSKYVLLEKFKAFCMVCEYKLNYTKYYNILYEIDVLISHLNVCHNVNEDSGCKEKTRDNDADGITRQSIEENNAGPSSHHDNAPNQPLNGNQEDQQGLMLQ